MPHKPLVAISGKMKSGKDFLGAALSQRLRVPVAKFATPLKAAYATLGFGDGEITKNRMILQEGAKFITDRYPWHFTRLLEEWNPTFRETGMVITDLRRPQEYIWARANGFVIVRLQVPREVQIARGAEPDRLDQETETALDDAPREAWDAVLDGTRPVDELVKEVLWAWTARD